MATLSLIPSPADHRVVTRVRASSSVAVLTSLGLLGSLVPTRSIEARVEVKVSESGRKLITTGKARWSAGTARVRPRSITPELSELIERNARAQNLNPRLVQAAIQVESATITGPVRARGRWA